MALELIDTKTTDSNGEASITYTGTGAGEIEFRAKVSTLLQETFVVYDTIKYDTGTSSDHNDIWTLSSSDALTRGTEYTILSEPSTSNVTARTDFLLENTIIEFDSKCVDGSNVQFVRFGQGSNTAMITVYESDIGNWHHYKLVIDNTSTMKVYKDYSETPSERPISQNLDWSSNVRFYFWTTDTNTTIHFKNFKVYSA